MTVTLDFPAEIEARLVTEALARGLTLDAYVEQIVESAVSGTLPRPTSRKSLAQLFAESPFKGLEMDFPRDQTPLRSADL